MMERSAEKRPVKIKGSCFTLTSLDPFYFGLGTTYLQKVGEDADDGAPEAKVGTVCPENNKGTSLVLQRIMSIKVVH